MSTTATATAVATAPSGSRATRAVTAVGTVVDLELRQRVRSVAWYVLLGVFAVLLLIVTGLLLLFTTTAGREGGRIAFSAIVFFVLLLGSLVTPALSGGAVNGDRDSGTLATTQVTLVSTGELLIGKFLAAWTASLAFLAVALPFLLVAVFAADVPFDVVAVSVPVTVLELGVIAAVGVGFSAIVTRPIFSVVSTYLVVAALSIGSLIAFGLGGAILQTTITSVSQSYRSDAYDAKGTLVKPVCDPPETSRRWTPRFDLVWGFLAVNPYVVLADAVPSHFTPEGYPTDAFSGLQSGVRYAQIAPRTHEYYSECNPGRNTPDAPNARDVVARTVPSWFVGLGLHLLLAAGMLLAAFSALRTPARRLAKGSRIA